MTNSKINKHFSGGIGNLEGKGGGGRQAGISCVAPGKRTGAAQGAGSPDADC